jgi:predicted phage terminase large subunit-like protein
LTSRKRTPSALIRTNQYIPATPTPKQTIFLRRTEREGFYGGSARGGKTVALLMAALQYVDVPGYSALLLRRTYADLALPRALIDLADEWLRGTDAHWDDETHTWTFPSGATLTFGYLDSEKDKYRYQGTAFQFIGFDELTQFTETQYQYLFSRLVRPEGSTLPIRMRCTSNPGGTGHAWVKQRFIKGVKEDRVFVPAGLRDNPHVDQAEYIRSLDNLDHITRAQLLNGDWDISGEGTLFKRQWFEVVEAYPKDAKNVRYWDLASSKDKGDYTAGAKVAEKSGIFYLVHMHNVQESPGAVQDLIRQTAAVDGIAVQIGIEEEGGASGKIVSDHYARDVLKGFAFTPYRNTGDKVTRAKLWSSAAEHGNFKLVQGPWIESFLDQVAAFPETEHDDMVDAVSGAFVMLTEKRSDSSRFRIVASR